MKKSIYLILLLSITAILSNGCDKPKKYDIWGAIEGVVKCKQSNGNISNYTYDVCATLILDGKIIQQCFTNSKGEFEFKDLEADIYTLSISKDGYVTTEQIVNVYSGESTPVAVILNEKQEEIIQYGSIRGIAYEQYIYQPNWTNEIRERYCDDALVCLYQNGELIKSTMSEMDGIFRLKNILEGLYTISFQKEGYLSKELPIAVNVEGEYESDNETFIIVTLILE